MSRRSFRTSAREFLTVCSATMCAVALLAGCASAPKPAADTQQSAPAASAPAASAPAAPAQSAPVPSGPSAEELQTQLSQRENELAAVKEALSRVQKSDAELQKKYEALLNALNQVAYARGVPAGALLSQAAPDAGSASTAGTSTAASLSTGSLVATVTDTEGNRRLVDFRANAATGSDLFLSVIDAKSKPPVLVLTVQYRYPDASSPFLTQTVELSRGKTSFELPLDKFQSDWYRSGPFKVEAFTTTDIKILQTAVNLVVHASAADPARIVLSGADGTARVRLVTADEVDALSNMVYTYRELGGTEIHPAIQEQSSGQ